MWYTKVEKKTKRFSGAREHHFRRKSELVGSGGFFVGNRNSDPESEIKIPKKSHLKGYANKTHPKATSGVFSILWAGLKKTKLWKKVFCSLAPSSARVSQNRPHKGHF